MQTSAPLAALLAIAAASADIFGAKNAAITSFSRTRDVKALGAGTPELPAGCLYEGRWFVEGAAVVTREACLRCRCARGALSCARRACLAPPDPPPRRCHLLHRRGACCPELHCPDGVTVLEHSATARFDDDLDDDVATPASASHACVEGGAVFAAGSALGARAACEQCFCLLGARRCVRPRCLPPPAGCRARPAPPACCPQRYYCDRPADSAADSATAPPHNHTNPHDCEVEGSHVPEGERVSVAEREPCTQCFCLRGRVRCQPLACAPPLHGCQPLLRPGHCCPHQYSCNHTQDALSHHVSPISHNALILTRYEDRSLDTSRSNKYETTAKTVSTSPVSSKNTISEPSTKEQHVSTSKVKRKTSDSPPTTEMQEPKQNVTVASTKAATKTPAKTTTKPAHKQTVKLALITSTTPTATSTTTEAATTTPTEISSTSLTPSTEQSEGTVRIMINGTINCTAELSHSPLNKTENATEEKQMEAPPRFPVSAGSGVETQTSGPVDIITDRNINDGFDETEIFTINVTSSLRTNHSHTTAPSLTTSESVPKNLSEVLNISKKNKEDYDYDYNEPTLPPSLPNLKIIPFVAADAVVDEDADKGTHTYPALEREDKFPVYYPSKKSEPPFATRREDVFPPHPVFGKEQYSPPNHAAPAPAPRPAYTHAHKDLATSLHELTASAALETHVSGFHKSTKPPRSSTKSEVETPAVNLFSPPVETEGGFIPKGPGIIDEYYAVYPSTPVPPSLPHLTTSMQLDTGKADCFSSDGRLVPDGDSIALACSVCACAWGELHCSPRACPTPRPGCRRRPATASDGDLCCGQLICHQDNKTTTLPPELSTRKREITLNVTKVPVEIPSDVIPFDPPPDRREPATNRPVTIKEMAVKITETSTNKMSIAIDNVTSSNDNKTFKEETITNSSIPSITTEKSTTDLANFTVIQEVTDSAEVNETSNQSQEYEDEEEDEGFSFGSVLKLLLSDSYEPTTAPPLKKKLPTTITKVATTTTTAAPKLYSTTRRILPKPTVAPFMPLPNHHYIPSKKNYQQNTINRIDHLVLGEATAIRKPSPRPSSTTPRPVTTSFIPYTRQSSTRPIITTRPLITKKEEHKSPSISVSYEIARPPAPTAAPGPGVGSLLKLAGCNIYGQMYRVGRIIAELSTPCQECRCTELGVSCHPLTC